MSHPNHHPNLTHTYDDAAVLALHKDACGYLPGSVFMRVWNGLSPNDKQGMWDYLRQAATAKTMGAA
jgi:hypothetical protein